MAFGTRLTADLEAILRAGASLDINGGNRMLSDLTQLARVAQSAGVTLCVRGAGNRQLADLQAIARAGGKSVTFAD